jgi:antibiotic biosynthesis monooxygenase (ABM) superfamily enzyme
MNEGAPEKKKLPAWLLGLIIALVIFAIVLVVANLLGFGDDPAIGALPWVTLG